jgi:hypothetical protein
MATPLVIAFSIDIKSPFLIALDLFIDVFFMLDIILNFRTGYFPWNKSTECTDPKRVAIQYVQGWFVVDLIATVPWGQLLTFLGNWPKIFRSIKLVRLFKVPQFMETLDNHISISKAGVAAVFLVLGMVLMVHWAACLFFFISLWFHDLSESQLPFWMPPHVDNSEVSLSFVLSFFFFYSLSLPPPPPSSLVHLPTSWFDNCYRRCRFPIFTCPAVGTIP